MLGFFGALIGEKVHKKQSKKKKGEKENQHPLERIRGPEDLFQSPEQVRINNVNRLIDYAEQREDIKKKIVHLSCTKPGFKEELEKLAKSFGL